MSPTRWIRSLSLARPDSNYPIDDIGFGVLGDWSAGILAQDQSQPATDAPNKQERLPKPADPRTTSGPTPSPRRRKSRHRRHRQPSPKDRGYAGLFHQGGRAARQRDVMVTTKDGQFIPGLKKDNFRVMEDGSPAIGDQLRDFAGPDHGRAAGRICLDQLFLYGRGPERSYAFANSLKKNDWVAVISYDMKPHILADFTQDKQEVYGALNQLRIPGFAETNLFDALYDTLDRVDQIEGRKYVVLVTTGIDTFSKLNLDEITKKVKSTHDVTIFPISVGFAVREYCETHSCGYTHGIGIPVGNMDYLQGDNEMNTFARLTGGRAYFPRFQGELPEIFHDITGDIRNQYNLSYHPTNPKLDGTYRKLKVEVVAPDGGPLKVKDQKGKDVKYQVIAREGYTAKHTVE